MKKNKYACWNKARDEPADEDNCHLSCERKKVPYTSPTWFDGWIESESDNCQLRIRDVEEVNNMFNKFFG